MYRRPSEEKKSELRAKYEGLQEYMVAYNAINVTSERYNDLSPEEIWDEAAKVVTEISQQTFREWKVQHVFSQLKRKYSVIQDENGTPTKRTEKEQELTATLVLFDVICMLSLAKRLEPEQAEQHPYFEHMKTILSFFCHSVLFNAMLAVLQQDEETIEEMTGHELQPHDYMETVPVVQHVEEENDLEDDIVRIACLQKIYAALKQQLGDEFTGKSQWFYVYEMMAEGGIYETKSYSLFESDLEAAGVTEEHMPNTNTFSRKREQIKEGTTFPHWKVKAGGKQTTLNQGTRIARIAFKILYK